MRVHKGVQVRFTKDDVQQYIFFSLSIQWLAVTCNHISGKWIAHLVKNALLVNMKYKYEHSKQKLQFYVDMSTLSNDHLSMGTSEFDINIKLQKIPH